MGPEASVPMADHSPRRADRCSTCSGVEMHRCDRSGGVWLCNNFALMLQVLAVVAFSRWYDPYAVGSVLATIAVIVTYLRTRRKDKR